METLKVITNELWLFWSMGLAIIGLGWYAICKEDKSENKKDVEND